MKRPSMNQIAVEKKSVEDREVFDSFLQLYNLAVISEEPDYYILDGSEEDLLSFLDFWNVDEPNMYDKCTIKRWFNRL